MGPVEDTENATVSSNEEDPLAAYRMALEAMAAMAANANDSGSSSSKTYSAPSSPTPSATSPTPASPASPAMMLNQNHPNNVLTFTTPSPSTPASGAAAASNTYQEVRQYNITYARPIYCVPISNSRYLREQLEHQKRKQQQEEEEKEKEIAELSANHDNTLLLKALREKLLKPGGGNINDFLDQLILSAETRCINPLKIIKDRYLISAHRQKMTAAAAAKTPASYRHLVDVNASHLRCTDIFTEKQFLCKIVKEPLYKVQRAYYQLLREDTEGSTCTIYGHSLVREVHDIIPATEQCTYIIIAPPPTPAISATKIWKEHDNQDDEDDVNILKRKKPKIEIKKKSEKIRNRKLNQEKGKDKDPPPKILGVDYYYEDLHSYVRNKKRLTEAEARPLFHQICQTVQVCHQNGVIIRDLKLKRFFFIDEARTKLQYESLEGSMILEDNSDDTLYDKIGCPLYTAPELLCTNQTYRGKPADMWSLGVLLYTMLVGQYPFYEKGNCSLITVIRHCQVPLPSMLSRPVRWLLMVLLRKNLDDRIKIDEMFSTQWLSHQSPYYMCIPANVYLSDDDDDDEDIQVVKGEKNCRKKKINQVNTNKKNPKRIKRKSTAANEAIIENDETMPAAENENNNGNTNGNNIDDDDDDDDKNNFNDGDNDLSIERMQEEQTTPLRRSRRNLARNSTIIDQPLDYSCARLQYIYNRRTTTTTTPPPALTNTRTLDREQMAASLSLMPVVSRTIDSNDDVDMC